MKLSDYFLIGKIGKPKSFKGEVFFNMEDEEVFFALGNLEQMNVRIGQKMVVYPIEKMSVKSNNKVSIRIVYNLVLFLGLCFIWDFTKGVQLYAVNELLAMYTK